jgi:putative transposase
LQLFDEWFDPIETGMRDRVRMLIEEMICGQLDAVLARPRYSAAPQAARTAPLLARPAIRHGSRTRKLIGTFGKTEIAVPRARLATFDGKTTEWKSTSLAMC